MSNSHLRSSNRLWQYAAFTLSAIVIVVAAVAIAMAKGDLDRAWHIVVHDFFRYPTWAEQQQQLYEDFQATNPTTLTGWKHHVGGPGSGHSIWTRDGIAYHDRDGDGRPDLKRLEVYNSTESFHWEDTDCDGDFDSAIEAGCFHYEVLPLDPPVTAPRP